MANFGAQGPHILALFITPVALPVCNFFFSVFLDFKGCNLSKCLPNRLNMGGTKGDDQEESSY
jgi:hypothetical protein